MEPEPIPGSAYIQPPLLSSARTSSTEDSLRPPAGDQAACAPTPSQKQGSPLPAGTPTLPGLPSRILSLWLPPAPALLLLHDHRALGEETGRLRKQRCLMTGQKRQDGPE